MATESRPEDPGLNLEQLRNFLGDASEERFDYFEFDFFQAVRLLCRLDPDGTPGKAGSPGSEVVRFRAHNDLAFPASQIRSLAWSEHKASYSGPVAEMTVCFMGLTGPLGVLPWAYTEHIRKLANDHERATADFFSIFDHRAISLFYRAWEKYRFFVQFERDQEDALSQYLMSLTGLGTPGLQKRQAIPDRGIVFFAGILSLLPRSASALEQVLTSWFDVPVRVDQFQGTWHTLRDDDRCRFADPPTTSETLGFSVVVGNAVYDCGSRVRIQLGPVGIDRYQDFLPGGADHAQLGALAEFFANGSVEFEVQLILKRAEVPPFRTGRGPVSLRLGWTTWMNARSPRAHDPGDTCFMLC
jgi:type VI secretion system protein ImpH